jgi:2-hydroxycyclohexanecarboxyl-CoA dehydrogenase
MIGLSGKVAVVTGGGGGIGAAICRRLAQAGTRVAVLDINLLAARDVAAELERAGVEALTVELDITAQERIAAAIDLIEAKLGKIDILINNAGWDKIEGFLATSPELWERIIAINLRGPIALTHHVLSRMVPRAAGGRIINIGSDAGRVGSSGEAVYSACKGGLVALGKSLAREFARTGITVNTVCPGPTDTPLLNMQLGFSDDAQKISEGLKRAIPMKRLGVPQDVAGIVAFLASDEAAFITGQTLSVSGGLTMHG